MNLFKDFRNIVLAKLAELAACGDLPEGLDTSRVTVEPPRDASHGDLSTNAAMVLAKTAGMKPRDLADKLVAHLSEEAQVAEASVAGPGFINLKLGDGFWQDYLGQILRAGEAFGRSDLGQGQAINVEYVSANPTGPLTVGHARGAVVGDALASLLDAAGYKVTREYYINDAGSQVDTLGRTAYLRYREALGEDIGEIPEGYYPGEYLKPVGQALADRDGDKWLSAPEKEWLPVVRPFAIDAMMDQVRADLARAGINQEVFTSERSLVEAGAVNDVQETLESRDLVYVGVLEPPKGKTPEDWEPRPQTLFRATQFGDDVDRPLKKSDGSWTYFANDMAYHLDKYRRGFAQQVDIFGADHGGYVKRMKAAVKALTNNEGDLTILLCQLVKLTRDGKEVKMSKRSGNFITLQDVVEEVGKDVLRFIMLTRKNDAALDFDLDKVKEQSKDNPVFYVQYAHARACSVLRHAQEAFPTISQVPADLAALPLARLSDDSELALIKQLAEWPRLVEGAAETREPHRIAFFLQDVASRFHALWTKGKGDTSLRFLIEGDEEITAARMALLKATTSVIASGLRIYGVEPVEEMR
ncbi:arginine--tRNA ligase [Rhodovibrionaceae bacterium A322]